MIKTLKVKKKNLNFNGSGSVSLKYVMGRRFINNGYKQIKYKGDLYQCSCVKFDLLPNKIVWIDGLSEVMYEI